MFLGFLDEADHTKKGQFTICGLTAIGAEIAGDLSVQIQMLIEEADGFSSSDILKSASSSRPNGCTPEQHKNLKNNVFSILPREEVKFFGYAYFNSGKSVNSARNQLFGFNTLLGKFNDFLKLNDDFGVVFVDRFQAKTSDYLDSFEYLVDKMVVGNKYRDRTQPLDRILSYGMTNAGSSYLCAANDLLTGGLRYIANETNPTVRKALIDKIAPCMAKGKNGSFREEGLTLRPASKDKLPAEVTVEYQILRDFLNANYSDQK